MLKYLPLVWSNLQRKRVRTTLTIASIAVAFLLFGLLQALQHALSVPSDVAGEDRLIAQHKTAIVFSLPGSYIERIRGVEGVTMAVSQNWVGGMDPQDQQIVAIATGPEIFDVYNEYRIDPQQKQAWLNNRGGALIGRSMANRYGWKVGDTIPLRSNIFTKQDGSASWPLTVEAIFDNPAGSGDNLMYMHYAYFNESVHERYGRDSVGWVIFRIEEPARSAQIAETIDTMFANSSTETKTTTEAAFQQAFANQMGDVGAVVTTVAFAVFFTMLLVSANTMGQSVRERTNELAVMKTLGFSSRSVMVLVLAESVFITALGGLIGLGLATLIVVAMGPQLQQFLPFSGLPSNAYVPGLVLIVALGVLAGALPCIQAFQLRITEALRRG